MPLHGELGPGWYYWCRAFGVSSAERSGRGPAVHCHRLPDAHPGE